MNVDFVFQIGNPQNDYSRNQQKWRVNNLVNLRQIWRMGEGDQQIDKPRNPLSVELRVCSIKDSGTAFLLGAINTK